MGIARRMTAAALVAMLSIATVACSAEGSIGDDGAEGRVEGEGGGEGGDE